MSLENIQLPRSVLRSLFRKSLVDLNSNQANIPIAKSIPFTFLGGHKARVSIIVYDTGNVHLSDPALEFLTGIMAACKLNLADIAIINHYNYQDLDYELLNKELDPLRVIIFGLKTDSLALPFHIPDFQVQSFNEKKYLVSPALDDLQKNKELKAKLWNSLQQFFELKK